jgi:hypothetical protein
VFTAGKGFGKIVQSDSGEVMVDVVQRKQENKSSFVSTFLVTARNC